jgi:hypothetical protein
VWTDATNLKHVLNLLGKTHVLNEWLFGPWGGRALGVTDVAMRYFRIPSSQVPWVMMLLKVKPQNMTSYRPTIIPFQNYVETYPLTPPQVATTKYIT